MKEKLWWGFLGCACLLACCLAPKESEGAKFELEEVVPEFAQLHERTVETFVSGESFGIYRLPTRDYWEERAAQIEGDLFLIRGLNLIGLTEEEGDRVYEEMIRFKSKSSLEEEGFRDLDREEIQAVEILRSGERPEVELISDEEGLRFVAPILAVESCLKCHEGKVGIVLGAFDYRLKKFERREGE